MPQVLKDEVRNRILEAAEEVFYEKDYSIAKLSEIAEKASVPVALIYTYFKNKEVLFDSIVESVYVYFEAGLEEEENLPSGTASERFEMAGESYVMSLLKMRKKLIILMDKSAGTKHVNAKDEFISKIQEHIEASFTREARGKYDPILSHILASNFTEGLLEIARHYKGYEWAKNIFKLLAQCYYHGVISL